MIDLLSDDVRRNPFPFYDRFRAASPVFQDPATGLWMIFDYEGVKRALSDYDDLSSSPSTAAHPHPKWLIFCDPPLHTRLRALIMRAFTHRVVAGLEPGIREISRRLLDSPLQRGEIDLALEYSIPLPMRVIAEMVGVPAEDWARFRRWSDSILELRCTIFDSARSAAASRAGGAG